MSTGDELVVTVDRDGAAIDLPVTPVRMAIDNGLGQMNEVGAINVGLSLEPLGQQRFGPIGAVREGIT